MGFIGKAKLNDIDRTPIGSKDDSSQTGWPVNGFFGLLSVYLGLFCSFG